MYLVSVLLIFSLIASAFIEFKWPSMLNLNENFTSLEFFAIVYT